MSVFSFLRGRSSGQSIMTRGYGGLKLPVRPYEATSNHPAVPNVPRTSPNVGVRYLREQQALAEHMVRNDSWIRSLVRVLSDIHVGTGPEPVCRFPELEELFRVVAPGLQNSGRRSFGGMLREDIYKQKVQKGEAFVRVRDRADYPEDASRLTIPVQLQALSSEYVPTDHDRVWRDGIRFEAGIATVRDRPVAYAMHTEHPYSETFQFRQPITVPAEEVFHVFEGPTGCLRGEVPLASAFLRAIAMSTVEDAERRRKQIAATMGFFFKRKAEDAAIYARNSKEQNSSAFPDARTINDMLRVQVGTGTGHELPPGFEVELLQPKDEPMNFEKALRFQLLAICATAGAPFHEVSGDWKDAPERALRLSGASIKRRAEIERENMEHQFLSPFWRVFVDYAMLHGLWTPPPGIKPWHLYEVSWDWPVIQAAALTQELNVMMDAADRGYTAPSDVTKSYFGKRREIVDRVSAKDRARSRELGLMHSDEMFDPERSDTSKSIAEEARLDEERERKAVEESYADDSVVDD